MSEPDAGPSAAAELLSPAQIERRLARASVAFLPVGSLEFHGPHLPIGLDALTASGICLAAAERIGGVRLPAVHQGVGGEHVRYPWTLMSSDPRPIEAILVATIERLAELGVARVVILSGHFAGEQRDLVHRVAAEWEATGGSSPGEERTRVVARTLAEVPDPPVAPDHAGRFETLLLQSLHPELVDVRRLPDPGTHPLPAGEDPFGRERHDPVHPLHGVFGPDPRLLDPRDGPPLLEHLVRWVCALATEAAPAP